MMLSAPEATASSTPYWMIGLSTSGSISFGWALVAGRKRVPRPAAGKIALRIVASMRAIVSQLQSLGTDVGKQLCCRRTTSLARRDRHRALIRGAIMVDPTLLRDSLE